MLKMILLILENKAKIIWLAKQIGTIKLLYKNELAEIIKLRNERHTLNYPTIQFNSNDSSF